tara:strand:- start:776 stop:940 length:165 start_codon:yes stop_codon:yes gene_type:complete
MSMARCDSCQVLIDTDIDPEAAQGDQFTCEACRVLQDDEAAYDIRNGFEPQRDF